MKKIHLVFLEKDKPEGLKSLREFGLVHLETTVPDTARYEEARRTRELLLGALNIAPSPKKGKRPARLGTDAAIEVARRIVGLDSRAKELRAESAAIQRELERIAPWGGFDPELAEQLRDEGVDLAFYECESFRVAEIPAEVPFIFLSKVKKLVRIAVVGRGQAAPKLPQEFRPFPLPRKSADKLRAEMAEIESQIADGAAKVAEAGFEAASMRRAVEALDQELAMETAATSFAAEGPVVYIKGYLPEKAVPAFSELCRKAGWAFAMDDPSPEDATPTKVENNAVVRMIQPVIDFLGIVPGYREYEISNWFLLYFVLFTAMIFGDGGYGAIMLVAAGVLIIRARRAGKKIPDFLRLLVVLATATFLWGMATATWFAIDPQKLPPILADRAIWLISNANPDSSGNVQVFCFVIGALQLLTAHVKNIIRDRKSLKFLAQIGSIFMILGMFFFVLNLVVSSQRFPRPEFATWFVLGGFALNFVFAAYDGNVFKSLLEGLKNIIPNFLGAVGVFADIVSYIRLWAVGLAGTSLARIINQMGGGMMKGLVMVFAGLTILLAGHALNMALSVLSVVVHGVRLNVLEFSNHLGMEWSGIKYDPFRVTYREEAH